MYCPNCGQKSIRRNKFCSNCGNDLTTHVSKKQKKSESHGVPLHYVLALLAAGILLGVVIIKLFDNGNEPIAKNIPGSYSIQSAAVLDIASEFICPCNTCDHPLDECDCEHDNGALEVKSFIAQKLREQHRKPHIVEMVQEVYGGHITQSTLPPDAFVKPGESGVKN